MRKIDREAEAYLRTHYPTTSNKELAKVLGVHKDTVIKRAKALGLRKKIDYLHELRTRIGGLSPTKGKIPVTSEVIKKRTATRKARIQHDKVRMSFGLERVTKYKIRLESKQKYGQRKYLKMRGYIIDEPNKIAYYDEHTQRSPRLESTPRGQTKGKLKSFYEFKPYEEKQ